MMARKQRSNLPEGTDVRQWVKAPACPACGGPMFDNRERKASGKYGPTRSDFTCKDKENCDKGVWLTAEEKAAIEAEAPSRAAGGAPAPAARVKLSPEQKKAGRDKVMGDYFGLMKLAAERMSAIAAQHKVPLDMGHVQAATFSAYKAMADHGYLADPPAAPTPAPEPPKPAPRPQPARQVPAQSDFEERPDLEADDDLPF